MITGNKGEWSELYALLRLLSDGRIYAADANLNRMEHVYSPISKVFRKELDSGKIEYVVRDSKHEVELYYNGDKIKSLSFRRLSSYADELFRGIVSGNKSSFEIPNADIMMKDIKCTKIKASSDDKTDIMMEVYDRKTGYNSVVGYSIKSELGSPPTLLNASGATNFRYTVDGISDKDMEIINAIDTRSKIQDRIISIAEKGTIKFDRVINDVFKGNLELIDTRMDAIISQMLFEYYKNGKVYCSEIATSIESRDPLGFNRDGIYRYKIKKLLCAIALGMMPGKKWNGQDEANGGYIIVKESGDVVAYHLYNRNLFETYLLNNTKLETPSSSRHKFGSLYKENGQMYFNLNLQVRFV